MSSYKQLLEQLAPTTSLDSPLDKSAANRKKFEELVSWIDQNSDLQITLNDLLTQSGLSLQELTMQFKLQTKLSPLQFVKELRQYKQAIKLANMPVIDQTYALFDPLKK